MTTLWLALAVCGGWWLGYRAGLYRAGQQHRVSGVLDRVEGVIGTAEAIVRPEVSEAERTLRAIGAL